MGASTARRRELLALALVGRAAPLLVVTAAAVGVLLAVALADRREQAVSTRRSGARA
ncbi:hypothetical protein [Micromonospora siamensis]|uniref:hypothetical protein n=1 Tax=Micromonospora siamensis TaxID=299152 RepID=UPI0012FD8108|nr:hypothetical protein [Micromonospora siamensis]